jgi:hypothetical protein
MTINDAYPSKYLKAGDLPEEGSQLVTIEKIALEELGRDRDTKPVIYFEELDRGMVCNKTNARAIARVTGSEDFDDWIGRKIALYRAEVEFQGEMVEAIRVKLPKPVAAKAPAAVSAKKKTVPQRATAESEADADEIPF